MNPTKISTSSPDSDLNPDLDLTLERVIRAPRTSVWSAWTDPSRLAQWWIPAPTACRVERLDLWPGGGFVTSMSDDGASFEPHMDVCFLAVDHLERIVFTNVVDSSWRPANPAPVPLTATISFADHADGTEYRVVVRHGDAQARALHSTLGFAEGWASVAGQLAAFAESSVNQ